MNAPQKTEMEVDFELAAALGLKGVNYTWMRPTLELDVKRLLVWNGEQHRIRIKQQKLQSEKLKKRIPNL